MCIRDRSKEEEIRCSKIAKLQHSSANGVEFLIFYKRNVSNSILETRYLSKRTGKQIRQLAIVCHIGHIPVSYTHLDVYKRQVHFLKVKQDYSQSELFW